MTKTRGDGFTLVDFDIPTRVKPCSHPGVDCPLCDRCQELELSFFDPTCVGCSEILLNPETTISQIFAIMRQWIPQVQQNIDVFITEILRRGGHVNDRDGLTDMTMLHYASKSGAGGVGDPVVASETVQSLIEKSADFAQKCRWTDMLPLHYATFFDIVPVINILLNASGGSDADAPCKEFDNGTPLHIACSNLCLKAAKCLLQHKANPNFRDASGRKPRECLPPGSSLEQNPEMQSLMLKMQALLLDAENSSKLSKKESLNDATLHALGLSIGDDVIVSGKVSHYCHFK
ncbi:CAP-Gly domain-containing linker protein 3-like isoform X2 [Rhopilema esculentum]|uniref:CAP-Gly domain-containing linker protein 3-like isoform X2 n=1 Tax=Rhopilema esculentum TaxID=499914 RepID=UPI0031D6C8D9